MIFTLLPWVTYLISRRGPIELYVEEAYKKYNNNHGYVTQDDQEALLLAQSFSHFTYQDSKQQILVIDIQCIDWYHILFYFSFYDFNFSYRM